MADNTKLKDCPTCGKEIATTAKVCPHCGAKNKNFKKELWWRIPLACFLALITLGIFGKASVPTCDSETGINNAKRAFDTNQMFKLGYKLEDFGNIEEVSYDDVYEERVCSAKAYTDRGEIGVLYSFKMRDNGEYLIQIRPDLSSK
ncbi:MAG: hypothetical protein CL565_04575 [Alphaproteobacteria bacterium]|nr:hypothetical protein [Alphaproteobacteria bacterium]|tara:strand:+ start:433 stop:870 length:438 start_codon:yes stop_codon:yes gene_type:complete